MLLTRNKRILRLVEELRKIDDSDQNKVDAWAWAHVNELIVHRDLMGTIESDFLGSSGVPDDIVRILSDHLASNHVVLEEGGTPIHGGPIAAIVIGCIIAFITAIFWGAALFTYLQTPARSRENWGR